MSGIYQNWIKVQNPELSNNIIPMKSGGYQTPFFFGGSQVPSALNISGTDMDIKGKGINDYFKGNFRPEIKGKSVQSSLYNKHSNIHLPRQLGSLYKPM